MNKISRFIEIGIKRPKTALSLCLILLVFFLSGLRYFQANFSARIWHQDDSIEIIKLNEFERQFGGDEVFLLGVDYNKSIFNKDILTDIQALTEKLWLLPDVLRVDSFSNINHIAFDKDDINITPLVPETISETLSIEKNSESMNEIQNVLIDKSKSFVLFSITINPSFGKNPDYSSYTKKLYELLEENKHQINKEYYFLGSVAVANAFKDVSTSDNAKLLPLMFGLIILVLAFYFRSILGVLIPISIVLLTVSESFGFLAFMGYKFNSILGAIPGVLLGICLADAIHILTIYYQELDKGLIAEDAMKSSLHKNLLPTLLTTLTTSISFLSISFTELVPIHDLGLVSFFGTLMAWINSYLLIPSLIMLFFKNKTKKRKPHSFLRIDYSAFIIRNAKKITWTYISCAAIALLFCFYNEANSDPLKYFTEGTRIREDFNHAESKLGAVRTLNIVVDSLAADNAKDPLFLKKIEGFTNDVEKLTYVTKVRSILDTVKKMNKNLTNQSEENYAIPATKSHVAEYLLLYSLGTSPGLGLENQISSDNRHLNIKINWNVEDTNDSMKKNDEIHELAKKWELDAHTAGTFSIYAGVNDKVVKSFFKSILLAVASVSLIIFLVFRNFYYAFLAMLPNFIPLLFVGAYTALSGIYIDVGSSIVFTICLGIAVDDTIHFMIHYIENLKTEDSFQSALRKTFMTSGEAIFLTTLVLVAGFGSFVLADFLPNKKFGVLASMVLILALITDLVFLPAILSFKGKKEN